MTEYDELMVNATKDVAAAYVGNNSVPQDSLPALIKSIHGAFVSLSSEKKEEEKPLKPAVTIKNSVKPDFIVCLEDGKKYKSLKRHLRTCYNMSPEEYRKKWGLDTNYPMVAPNYAAHRSVLAKRIGLGTVGRAAA